MAIKEAIAETILEVTNKWEDPIDDVYDVPPIVNALLATFNITPKETN